jgi:hypothetical protein
MKCTSKHCRLCRGSSISRACQAGASRSAKRVISTGPLGVCSGTLTGLEMQNMPLPRYAMLTMSLDGEWPKSMHSQGSASLQTCCHSGIPISPTSSGTGLRRRGQRASRALARTARDPPESSCSTWPDSIRHWPRSVSREKVPGHIEVRRDRPSRTGTTSTGPCMTVASPTGSMMVSWVTDDESVESSPRLTT